MPDRPRAVLATRVLPEPVDVIPTLLLQWSETELRDLPWRRTRDPWHILVSEAMLQQTQVSRVIDRYHTFLERFPTAASCADSPTSAVIELWAGLGYNRRAVNLWKTAVLVRDQHDGIVPSDLEALLSLPGIGPYTARAVLAFAYEHDVAVVDTNVGRLLARWTGQSLTPKQAQSTATELLPVGEGWRWNQTLFDFAGAICAKREPACARCPVVRECAWRGQGADPAHVSAGVSGKQSAFVGSKRQVRGRIVDALRSGPVPLGDLASFGRVTDSAADVERIADGLIDDGLAQRHEGCLRLPS